jgi:hypothetical protein
MALFYGGLAQLLAGMWEFVTGNTFGATGEYLRRFSHHHFVSQVGGVMVHLMCECTMRSARVARRVSEVSLLNCVTEADSEITIWPTFFYRDNLTNNLFHVAFTSYGAFWLSFATLFIPGSGVGDAYKAATPADMEDNAIGIFLMAWMVLTALFL